MPNNYQVRKSIEFKFDDRYEILYFVSPNMGIIGDSIAYAHVILRFEGYTELRSGSIYFIEPNMTLSSFGVRKEYRNKGIGSSILKYIIDDAISYGVSEITLDDMSNNYRKNRNIYLKHGFYYVEDWGPEMKICL